eukprot:5656355-Prorocentrum_lima.AAC.1
MDRHRTNGESTDGWGQVDWLVYWLESVALHELVAIAGSPGRRVAYPQGEERSSQGSTSTTATVFNLNTPNWSSVSS